MRKEDFLILVKRYNENKCSAEEKQLVEHFFDTLQESDADKAIIPTDATGKQLLTTIKAATGQTRLKRRKRFAKNLQLAAVLFVIAGLAATVKLITDPIKEITEIAARGERREIMLQDGSMVFLNSNSSITYPETFEGTRQVKLKGEAYFKVKRDTHKPFIVSTSDVKVKVLGTSFNINAYADNATKVSVLTGKVEVTNAEGKKVILTKNLQADLGSDHNFNVTTDDSNDGIAWTNNVIFLKNTNLGETARIIENWYDVKVDFEDPSLESLKISGKFKDEKLENVLNSIALLKELEIKYITKNHVLIRKKRQSI